MNEHSHAAEAPAAAPDRPAGPRYWRSLEELAADEKLLESARREFPAFADRLTDEATRRQFLQLMGASLALAGVPGCGQQPAEPIVPYVRPPEHLIPGEPLYYATAMTHDGAAAGLLVETHMARPTKIEGNPLHPSVPEVMRAANEAANDDRLRVGATDAFSQAVVLSLYDPDRSQTVARQRQIDTWPAFLAELRGRLETLAGRGGRGLWLLTETVTSPTLVDQLRTLLERFPEAEWHQYEPISRDQVIAGNRLAFGEDVATIYHVEQADVILSLDADFLAAGPGRLQQARGFARRRGPDNTANAAAMNRLYVVETGVTLTGAAADHRLPLSPRGVVSFASAVAAGLGLETGAEPPPADESIPPSWIAAVVEDLQRAEGRGLVLAGRNQPAVVHALAHWMNERLAGVGQTVEYREPIEARPEAQVDWLRALVHAMRNGEVDTLVIVGGNPVYDAPADLDFADALGNVPFSVHLSLYEDETSAACRWHIPAAHLLEAWSDTRAADGTVSIVQPVIAPLYGGRTEHELMAALLGEPQLRSYDIVRGYWQRRHQQNDDSEGDFDALWQTALHDGVIAGTEAESRSPQIRDDFVEELERERGIAAGQRPAGAEAANPNGVRLYFRPSPSVWDGRFANNGWLQELPQPLTKLTWDNAALISPQTAEEQGLETADIVELRVGRATIEAPVFVLPGQPRGSVTLFLGYGRTRAGRVGNRVGVDVYPLRNSWAMWSAEAAAPRKTGRRHRLASTQQHHSMEGRPIVRTGTLQEYLADPDHPAFMVDEHAHEPLVSLYPEWPYTGHKWGMVVNQSACIGCNACVVACQAENNIPVVGRGEVARGREMHWLRIDHYYEGDRANPQSYHQPMMCVHCELAPCEPVCPVAATSHSSEGINEMTYNRCVGTRYCANNCPYKVRRFNFFDYNAALRDDAVGQLRPNPDVTIRSRGVMEKCTYCVQRINSARIEAEKQDRRIRDGEMVTACQAACPTEAIIFGDLNDPNSAVVRAADTSLNYSVLGELNTRPRTVHLAAVRNLNPALGEDAST